MLMSSVLSLFFGFWTCIVLFSDLIFSRHSNFLTLPWACPPPSPQPPDPHNFSLNPQALPIKTRTLGKSKTLSTPSHFMTLRTGLPICSKPSCSLTSFPASQVYELFRGRVVSGWSYISEPDTVPDSCQMLSHCALNEWVEKADLPCRSLCLHSSCSVSCWGLMVCVTTASPALSFSIAITLFRPLDLHLEYCTMSSQSSTFLFLLLSPSFQSFPLSSLLFFL